MEPRNRKIDLMGIINLTPDSFYRGSRFLGDIPGMLRKVERMAEDGASIIDIGAFSSRPGAPAVPPDEQIRRLEKPLLELRKEFEDLPLSIDTSSSKVVEKVFSLIGPFTVNDISAGEADPGMLRVAASLHLPYIAMHMRGTPSTMQGLTYYTDIVREVREYFLEFDRKAILEGLQEWILDPGFGFAKTREQNFLLLDNLDAIRLSGHRTLVGVSRKSMFGKAPEEALEATQRAHLTALEKGADILRVHDVAEAAATVELYRSLSED
jgi:dihydropteroate synthase